MGLFPLLPMLSLVSAGSHGARWVEVRELRSVSATLLSSGLLSSGCARLPPIVGVSVRRVCAVCLCAVSFNVLECWAWSVGGGELGCGSPCVSRVDRGWGGEIVEVLAGRCGRGRWRGSVAWVGGVDRWRGSVGGRQRCYHLRAHSGEWRNWQTRRLQVPVGVTS